MLLGSQSSSTLIDIFSTGLKAVIREKGLPIKLAYLTEGCTIFARGDDMSKRVEKTKIKFDLKPEATADAITSAVAATGIPARLDFGEGTCSITLPAFTWQQAPKLLPIDTVVEKFVARSLRSRTWKLEVEEFFVTGFNINTVIETMKSMGASDVHLRAGNRPFVRVDNDLNPMDLPVISADDMRQIIMDLGGQMEVDLLETEKESSFQYHAAGVGYLRCSGYIKTGAMALAIRLIPEEPIPLEKLCLPPVVARVTKAHRGLFLVCGITGSGKSTTLAALVEEINKARKTHIITVEDPIEFVYSDKNSLVSQRMVGRDTYSFANALRGALREDPDLILVGEMRDMDTIRAGLSAAETGHLVFSTLHTTTAVDTVNRIISYFPQSERDLIRQELAFTLAGVVCQRLLKKIGGGRVPCCEILLGGVPIVRDAIIDGNLDKLLGIMENDSEMMSFDQHAVEMYKKNIVTKDEAISACRDAEAFERIMAGIKSTAGKLLNR